MNDLEKNIIELNSRIDKLYVDRNEIHEKLSEVKSRKNGASEKERRYSNKVNRISKDLDKLMASRLSLITVPSLAFWLPLLGIVFQLPFVAVVGIGVLGGVAGYRFSCDLIEHKMLREGDMRLLTRLFPSIRMKKGDLDKAISDRKVYTDKLSELSDKVIKLEDELESVESNILKLEALSKSMCNIYFSKLKREADGEHTDLEVIIDRTVRNTDSFYTNICYGLTKKERNEIIAEMSCKSCDNCTNYSCDLSDEEKANTVSCSDWYNEIEIGKSKVLRR